MGKSVTAKQPTQQKILRRLPPGTWFKMNLSAEALKYQDAQVTSPHQLFKCPRAIFRVTKYTETEEKAWTSVNYVTRVLRADAMCDGRIFRDVNIGGLSYDQVTRITDEDEICILELAMM